MYTYVSTCIYIYIYIYIYCITLYNITLNMYYYSGAETTTDSYLGVEAEEAASCLKSITNK